MTYSTPPYVPGPTPPPPSFGPPSQPRKKRAPLWFVLLFVAVAGLCVAGGIAAIGAGAKNGNPTDPAAGTTTAPAAAPVANDPTTSSTITAADIKLTVHTTQKDCFGSAGCNVEYEIKAALSAQPAECDVTYDVHGLQDTQTGTLKFHADGTYEQDSYQTGETSSSSKKLTAKVTEVDCS